MKVELKDFPVSFTNEALRMLSGSCAKSGKKAVRVSMYFNTHAAQYMYNVSPVLVEDIETEYKGLRIILDGNSSYFMKGTLVDVKEYEDGKYGFLFNNPNIKRKIQSPCSGGCEGCGGECPDPDPDRLEGDCCGKCEDGGCDS